MPSDRPRVLHLIEPSDPLVGPCGVAMLGDLVGASAARSVDLLALIVGSSGDERLAHDLGVRSDDRVPAVGGRPLMNGGAMRRYLSAVGPVDLLHCWSLGTLAMTALAAGNVPRILSLVSAPIDARQGRWLRTITEASSSPLTILCASNCIKRAWAHAGISPSIMHVVRPGLDLSRIQSAARGPLREEWGVAEATTSVVLVPAQHSRCVDAARIASIAACASLSGLDLVFVVPSDAARRGVARSMAAATGQRDRVIFDGRLEQPWSVLPGADIVLSLGDDTTAAEASTSAPRSTPAGHAIAALASLLGKRSQPRPGQMLGVTPMLWAAAAGKVVIAEAGYAVAEVAENGKTALVVKPGDDGGVVERLREVTTDSHKAWSLRDTARSEAFSFFSCSRHADNTVRIYEQVLAGAAVEVPPLPMTGGLAFAGRQ